MLVYIRRLSAFISTVSSRISGWFQEDIFRRLLLNAGKLLSANGIAAVLGVVGTILTARILGPENYGILALVLAYEGTVGRLVSFNAWQAIIKYGSEAIEDGNRDRLQQLIKFGFSLDASSAVVGTALAILLSGWVVALLGWDAAIRSLLILYSFLILFRWSGTPIGILRLFDRFDLLSYTAVISMTVRLLGIIWCVWTGQGLYEFVLVYLITGIVGQLYLLCVSLWELQRQQIGNFVTSSIRGVSRNFAGIWDYMWTTNVNSTIRLVSREADELIIAGLTSPAALGLFKVAKQFSRILPMLADPLYQSIYPELTKLWAAARRKEFVSLIKRTTLLVTMVAMSGWLGFLLLGQLIIQLTVGTAFQEAYGIAVIYMFALVISLCGFSLQPTMLALGLPRNSFKVQLIATILYLLLLFPVVAWLGIVGAAVAYVLYYLIWTIFMLWYLWPYFNTGVTYGKS